MLHWGISFAWGSSSTVACSVSVTLCGVRLARVSVFVSVHALAMKFDLASSYLGDSQTLLNQNKFST